jgi:hypothetical protein
MYMLLAEARHRVAEVVRRDGFFYLSPSRIIISQQARLSA